MLRSRLLTLFGTAVALLALGGGAGCRNAEGASKPFGFLVRVTSEPGEPVPSATLTHEGVLLGRTDASGSFALEARGADGESYLVEVRCPENLHSPAKPLAILLRRLNEAQARPRYDVSCPPRTRKMVVAVRADHGPNVAVRRLGREVARTDASGAALVALDVAPDEPVDLTLDTSSSPWLKPKDPTQRFQIDDSDGLFTFNQSFQGEPVKRISGKRARGPIRIGAR
ncbi:MAG: hypothetical protein QM784_21450 [Polyangiaceae bacterium]